MASPKPTSVNIGIESPSTTSKHQSQARTNKTRSMASEVKSNPAVSCVPYPCSRLNRRYSRRRSLPGHSRHWCRLQPTQATPHYPHHSRVNRTLRAVLRELPTLHFLRADLGMTTPIMTAWLPQLNQRPTLIILKWLVSLGEVKAHRQMVRMLPRCLVARIKMGGNKQASTEVRI